MKLFVFCIVVFVGLLAAANSEDGCKFADKSLKVGEQYAPVGECVEYTCQKDGGVSGKTCPSFPSTPNCKSIPGDTKKPFPGCCPRPECK